MKIGESVGCCELCNSPARVCCGVDEANLCWHCDAYVHGANFLAARHLRSLLCHTCGGLTEWVKAGLVIHPQIPFCQRCFSEVNCLGEFANGGDEESRSVSSAFSTKASFSVSGVGRCGISGRKDKNGKEVTKNGSKRQRSDNGSSSDYTQRLSVLLKKSGDVQSRRPAEMCCKEWTPLASFGDETDCGSSYEKCIPRLTSKRKQSEMVEKISSAVQLTLEDVCEAESSASIVSNSLKYKSLTTTTKPRCKRIRKNHSLRGSSSTSSALNRKKGSVVGLFKG